MSNRPQSIPPPAVPQPESAPRVTFNSAFEALYLRALKQQITPGLKEELKTIGLNLDKLDAAYTNETWNKALAITARTIHPGESVEESYFRLGARLVESYFETTLGKPLLAIVRLLGPKRTLLRMKQNFRTSNNYTESDFLEVGPNDYQLWLNEVGPEAFLSQGILKRGLELAGAPSVSVDVIKRDGDGTRFSVKIGA